MVVWGGRGRVVVVAHEVREVGCPGLWVLVSQGEGPGCYQSGIGAILQGVLRSKCNTPSLKLNSRVSSPKFSDLICPDRLFNTLPFLENCKSLLRIRAVSSPDSRETVAHSPRGQALIHLWDPPPHTLRTRCAPRAGQPCACAISFLGLHLPQRLLLSCRFCR